MCYNMFNPIERGGIKINTIWNEMSYHRFLDNNISQRLNYEFDNGDNLMYVDNDEFNCEFYNIQFNINDDE